MDIDLSNNIFPSINENLFLSPMITNINRLIAPTSFANTTYNIPNGSDISNNFLSEITNLLNTNFQSTNINRLINESFNDENKYKNVLDESGLNQIETVIYNANKFPDEKKCPISFLDFKQGDKINKLPCGHIFHSKSILKWLENEQAKCPVCRYELSSKEVKNTDISENILPRQSFTELFRNIIIERQERKDEELLQHAILESLNLN